MIRVRRNSDNATGSAWQRTAPTTMRELVVDAMMPASCDVGDYLIALDDGTWDAASAADYPTLYTVVTP